METNVRKTNVYVMVGLPGAGKDTWIAKNLPDLPVISRDDIRANLGMCKPGEKVMADYKLEKVVTGLVNSKLREYVEAGQDVIINNTNLKKSYRNELKKALGGCDVNWVYVVVEAPNLDVNKERRRGQIAPEVMDSLAAAYQAPTPDEYNEIIYEKQ
jgi:predicted kinase